MGKKMLDPREVRSIQVFHLNQIGDFLFSLPLLASLRQAFPHARITSVLRPHLVDLWRVAGQSDEAILRPAKMGWVRRLLLGRELRHNNPDISFLLAQSYEPALLSWLSGSRFRMGYTSTALGRLLTHQLPWVGIPTTENALRLLESGLGITPAKRDYVGLLKAPADAVRTMDNLLMQHGVTETGRLIVLGPQASSARRSKEWTDEGFALVADHFTSQPGTFAAVVGSEQMSGITSRIERPLIDLAGKTTIPELAALLERSALYIGIDSGVMHLAAASGKPVVGLFGPTDPTVTGPQGTGHRIVGRSASCSPCFEEDCSIGRICMMEITPGQVIEAAEQALAESAGSVS